VSPVARSTGHAGRALLVGTVSILLIMAVLFLAAVVYGHQASPSIKLGDATFHGGSTKHLAKDIANDGPAIFSDVSGGASRDLIVQHLGTDTDHGWYAFLARVPGKPRSCTWQWQAAEHLFRAKCDRSLTAPADGRGLQRFPVRIAYEQLDIDLNYADRPTTAPTTSTTTTTAVPRSGTPKSTTPG